MIPKAQTTKIKLSKWDYIKLKKNFCTANKIKGSLWSGKEYLETTHLIRGLYTKIYKELIQLKSKKRKQNKGGKEKPD